MLKAELKFGFPAKRRSILAFSLQPSAFAGSAFTLVELLTVLAIMGIIAGLAVSAIKNFGESDAMSSADQQVLGDVARARQLAMSQRTTVYMVFVPENFWGEPGFNLSFLTPAQRLAATNLTAEQFTGYTFMASGAMGDQPGQHRWHYLAPWQTLPQGTFISTNKFSLPATIVSSASPGLGLFSLWNQAYPHPDQNTIYGFPIAFVPVPTEDSPVSIAMPYVAFNYLGQLTFDGQTMANRHEYIPLARGIVAPAINVNTKAYILNNGPAGLPQVTERPYGNSSNLFNIIDIDPLTGRATLEKPQIK